MADVKNDWIGYLDRSYQQIRNSLLSKVTNSNPELTDHSDSNPFIILLSMFSATAEMLGYYIDNVGEEGFIATAKRRSSVIKHSKALDYRIKARHPEQVDLIITFNNPNPAGFTFSSGLGITTTTGLAFYSIQDVTVAIGDTYATIPIEQFTLVSLPNFGLTTGLKRQKLNLGTNYYHRSATITIGGQPYTEVSTFGFSTPTSRHFIVEIEEDGNAYVVLGDGVKGRLEIPGLTIAVDYKNTLGPEGKVGAGNFDKNALVLLNGLPLGLSILNANSVLSSSGGSFYEETESIRDNAVKGIRTLDRAVTKQDHADILEALPGVGRAVANFCCGKTIDLYIVPSGGGVPSTLLIAEAQLEIEDKKMITTFPVVRPAGETGLVIVAKVTARKRKSSTETKSQVEAALVEFGNIENQEINGAIRLSDIQALIDNLSNVDFVDLTAMYTKPYARPRNHTTPLLWTNETFSQSINIVNWRVEYITGDNIRIYREAIYQAEIPVGATYVATDGIFQFSILPNSYIAGQIWEFTTYPYLRNIQLEDFTIFKINPSELFITVIPAPLTSQATC